MRVEAKNPLHRRLYAIYLDGVDISDCCVEADDIAHEAVVFVRTRDGQDVRRSADGKRLTALLRGHVTLVPHVSTQRMGVG